MSEEPVISSLYPPPPHYYKLFTEENIAKLRKNAPQTCEELEGTELEYLIPPSCPSGDRYRSFGELWNFQDAKVNLGDFQIEQLYTTDESEESEDLFSQQRIEELKKLCKSLLLNFLELVGILSKNPQHVMKKIEHIRTILINVHSLLNNYRLHQSRETLILMMEDKIDKDKKEIEEIESVCARIEEKVCTLCSTYIDPKVGGFAFEQPRRDEDVTESEAIRQILSEN